MKSCGAPSPVARQAGSVQTRTRRRGGSTWGRVSTATSGGEADGTSGRLSEPSSRSAKRRCRGATRGSGLSKGMAGGCGGIGWARTGDWYTSPMGRGALFGCCVSVRAETSTRVLRHRGWSDLVASTTASTRHRASASSRCNISRLFAFPPNGTGPPNETLRRSGQVYPSSQDLKKGRIAILVNMVVVP